VKNRNELVGRVPWIDGVKTGRTSDAGYVLVGSGTRKGVQLVSVVLGSGSEAERDQETLALLNYGFRLYRRVRPVLADAELAVAGVAFYGDREVSLTAPRSVAFGVRRQERVRTVVDAPEELDGPLAAGTRVGTVSVYRGGKRVRVLPAITAEAVPGASPVRKLVHYLIRPWLVALMAALAAVVTVGRRRRRSAQWSRP
jgi:D-alanyl-D-alanine carboxypeptidase (penicillin-binding protein 5/6)